MYKIKGNNKIASINSRNALHLLKESYETLLRNTEVELKYMERRICVWIENSTT